MPANGVYSVSVPGVVDGWATLASAYGTVPLARILAPAIDYAKNGFAVSEIIAGQWKATEHKLAQDPAAAATFLPIADGGRDVFYKGPIAAAIVADLEKRDGLFDARDFADHRSDWVDPI